MERIKENNADEHAKRRALDDLKDNMANYIVKYNKSMTELGDLQRNLPGKLFIIQKDIDSCKAEKEKIDETALDTFQNMGLQGITMIDCLVQLRKLARSLEHGTSAYAPLVSIFKGI